MNALNTAAQNAMTDIDVIGGLTASAVLVDLTISVWVGRKTDRKNTDKIVHDNNATSKDAAHVTKKLFVGNPLLDEVMKKANAARSYVAAKTLPWMGDMKLLPMSSFLQFKQDMECLKDEFYAVVEAFLRDYDIQVSAMAFRLGSLFNRDDYPAANEIRQKFNMSWDIAPLPAAGDFRVDAENALRREMQEQYTKAMNDRVQASMTLMWGRLKETLEHMVDRLGETGGKPNIFRDSMLENAKELVGLLQDFNLAHDPAMEQARQRLASVIDHVEPSELRTNKAVRDNVKNSVADILDKFAF